MPLSRLWRALVLLAMLFAPLSMLGGHAAMAIPAPAAAGAMNHHGAGMQGGHCPDTGQDQTGQSSPQIDCMIACSAVPAAEFMIASRCVFHGPAQVASPPSLLAGLRAGLDPPPPRSA